MEIVTVTVSRGAKMVSAAMFWGLVALSLCGCGQNPPAGSDATTQPAMASADQKSGEQLWSENCSRCHNLRPADSFSDAQWEAIVHHMRLRANLTGREAREVTKFLQASR